ncbi:hypothetical protein JIN84_05465 [Luteolibacter yonseiensis]|uniref:Uncharacterized protein n=1 Tax=Luteolibacter yonseiensis TaxID=1144680 RepID=A0A934R2T4_9BACT|nr:hypothetical protein [Luteolibacter yonseiensis]MBK1815053.1 hypothetical protein [Luteolibacter yonseiensis]
MILRTILLQLLLVLTAFSQSDKKTDLEVQLLAEQFPEKLGQVYLVFGDKKSQPFDLPTNRLSDSVAAEGRTMVLKLAQKDVPLCTITLPDQGKSFALLLVAAKPSGFKPLVIRTDDSTFRAGDVFFVNSTDKTILGKLGTAPLTLKPGETTKSRPNGAVDNTYYNIAFAIREGTTDKLISSTRWPVDQGLRSYVFFFTNAEGRTTYRAVDEYLKPATAAP